MQAFFDAIINFFRRLFSSDSGGGSGGSGGMHAPPASAPYASFFFKVATTEYDNFVAKPIETIDRLVTDPTVNKALKDAVNQGAAGYTPIKAKIVGEAQAGGAVVWICIWIVR